MKRTPLVRKTPMRRTGPPGRIRSTSSSTSPRRHSSVSPNEFPESTRLEVRRRSGGRCEVRSRVCTGEAAHFHHRQSRGGKDQRAVNCLHACSECHAHLHAEVTKARMMGWIVPSWADPAEVPVRRGDWGR